MRAIFFRGVALCLLFSLLLTACGQNAAEPATPAEPAVTTQPEAAPLSAGQYFAQGNVAYEQGDFAAAVEAFRQAATLAPNDAGYWHNLGVAQYSLNALEEAQASFARGLELAPDDAELNYLMGVVLIQFEQLDEAEAYLIKAQQLDVKLPEPYFGLGVLYKLQGKRDQAIEAFQTFLDIGPGQDPNAMQMAQQELDVLQAQPVTP